MQAVENRSEEILRQTEAQLQARVQQQAVVAELGQLALTGVELENLFQKAVSSVAETLEVEFCKILELLPEKQELILRAGFGWNPNFIGAAIVSASLETQSGYTLLSAEPVIVEDWLTESRFRPSRLFREHKIRSGLSVAIGGQHHAFGILSADTPDQRRFNHDDIYFLQAIANVLAVAIEKKQAERLIRQQAELIELSREPIFAWELNGGIIFWNQGCEQLYGYMREEAIGQVSHQLLQTIHPVPFEEFKTILARDGQWSGEIVHTRRDGRQIMVESRHLLICDVDDRCIVLETNHDITERKKFEEMLQSTNTLLQAIIEGTGDVIFVKDREGRYLLLNSAAAKAVDKKPEELIGLDNTQYLPPELAQAIMIDDQKVMDTGQTHVFENMITISQSSKIYQAVKTPYRDAEGNIQGVIGIARDITEQKQAELSQRLLAEAGNILASSLDYRTRLADVAQLAVPSLADWCSVVVVEQDETVSQVAVAHVNPAKAEMARELQHRYPVDWDAPVGAPKVLRTGRSELYPEISDEMLVAAAQDEEHLEILRDLKMRSAMIVPLIARGRSLGVMTFVWAESGRHYRAKDLSLAEELAHRAAMAIDNAWLYEAERRSRKGIEQTLNRLASLQAVTAALSEALTPSQVTEAIVEKGLIALNANSGLIMLLDAERKNLEIIGSFGYPAEQIERWRRFPLSTPVPLAESVLTGEPIYIPSYEALQTRYPMLGPEKNPYNQSLVTLPLIVSEQTIGVIGLSFPQASRKFSAEMRSFMMSLARQCAQALERARLYEAEQKARAEAEATQQRLAVLAEIKERNRLAGELHDTVAQALGYLNLKMATANMLLAQGQVAEVQTSLQELKQIIGETYTDVREEIFNLRSSAVPGIHFMETLEDYLSKYKRFYNLDIKIKREAEQHYFEFPDEVGVQLIRTIQEALINIRKHAQVNEALIRLGRTGTEVWITIEDKGRGFVTSKLKNEGITSFGIQIMKERIEKAGGRLEIHSVPNEGTQINLYYDTEGN